MVELEGCDAQAKQKRGGKARRTRVCRPAVRRVKRYESELPRSTAYAGFRHEIEPVFDLLFRPLLSESVSLLELADQPLTSAADLFQIVVGELGPLLSCIAFDLFPLAFELIPIHLAGTPFAGTDKQ